MLSSSIVLSDSRKHNLIRRQDTLSVWTAAVKDSGKLEPSGSLYIAAQDNKINDHSHHHSVSLFMKPTVSTPTPDPRMQPRIITHTHFASPLRTLSESIMDPGQCYISIHDLVEAYNVLSTRLRTLMQMTSPSADSLFCLTIFQEESEVLEQCLSRDIQRLLPSPFDSQHYAHSFANNSYCSQDAMDDDDLKRVTDNVTLCRYALRLLSDIFAFPIVHQKFTDIQLTSMLRDVLLVCATTSCPVPNSRKSCAIVVWMLKSQQLPTSVLQSVKIPIISALKNTIIHGIGGHTGKLDAFKALHHILTKDPSFFYSFVELLPSVLDHLNAESLETRISAALALSGLALAKCKLVVAANSHLCAQASKVVEQYIITQGLRKGSSGSENLLPAILRAALEDEPFWTGYGPSFTMTVTSSLLILVDRWVFSSPLALKLVFRVLEKSAKSRRSNIRALQTELWRIVIWEFSRVPVKADLGFSQDHIDKDVREPAFLVSSQDPKNGIGLALVAALLPMESENTGSTRISGNVDKAIAVLSKMIKDKDKDDVLRNDGIQILDRLLDHIGGSKHATDTKVVRRVEISFSWALVDGSLLSQDARKVTVPPVRTAIEDISPLSEEEVLNHWDALFDAWISATQVSFNSRQELSPVLLRIWQALLLVQSDLTQEHLHLTAPPAFALHVTSIITAFSIPLGTPETQIGYLSSIGKLWAVLKNVFTTEWLSTPAGTILAKLLKIAFTLSDERVKEVWIRVCADLISVSIPALLGDIHLRSESQEGPEVTRQLWNTLGQSGSMVTASEDWRAVLRFLTIPFGAWDQSEFELGLWEGIFGEAIEASVKSSEENTVSYFMGLMEESKLSKLGQSPRLIWYMTSQSLRLPSLVMDPKLLALVDQLLLSSYPVHQEDTPETSPLSLEPLLLVGNYISRLAPSGIVGFLTLMQKSLSCWIIDELKVLEADQHNKVLALFYKKPLELLAGVEPSIHILHELTDFILSVFVRVRGDGPFAFHTFWRSTYHLRTDIPKNDYPDAIKVCLKAWSDICDDSLGDGISLGSESQSLEHVPDSQPSHAEVDPVLRIEQSWINERTKDLDNGVPNSDDVATPVQRQHTLPFLELGSSRNSHALRALQEYGSRYDDNGSENMEEASPASRPRSSLGTFQPTASSSKRPLDPETPPVSKKRRIEAPRINFKPRAGKERALNLPITFQRPHKVSHKASGSEPALQTPYLSPVSRSASQPSHSRPRRRTSETPSWLWSDLTRLKIPSGDPGGTSDSSAAKPLSPMESSDDYDTWEKAVSAEDLEGLQTEREDISDFIIPDSGDNPDAEEGGDTEAVSDEEDSNDEAFLSSPSLGEYPLRSRRRHRSQTAPEPSTESHLNSTSSAHPLRRNQTSPIPDRKTPAQFDALQRAYAAIADAGVSQIDVHDIMQARRLANQINQVLDEQMCLKFTESRYKLDH